MIIRQDNNLDQNAQVTYLANDVAAGTTALLVKNSTGLTDGWALQIGKTGEERTEIKLGTAANVGTINVATTSFPHPANTPVYFLKFNQIVFERSATGTAGTAVPMTDGTITIQADNPYTQFEDATGSITYAYKTYYKNSALSNNSIESDWIVITPEFYWLSSMRERVKEKLWNSSFITDGQIDNWINEWREEMVNAAIAVNQDYTIGTVDVAFSTTGLGTVTTADYKQPRRVDVTYNGSDWFQSTKMMVNETYPNEDFNTTHPYHNWEGDSVVHILPAEDGGTARIYFYRLGTPMVNDTDGLPLSMRGYTKSFVDYSLGQAYQKEGKTPEARDKFGDANAQRGMFVAQISPRDKTGPTMIQFTDVTDGEG